jgi:SH3-like domain-containing protein
VRFLSIFGIYLIASVGLGPLASSPAQAATAVVRLSEPVCIVKAGVRLRKGPNLKFAPSWSVPKFMPLLKIEVKGTWARVQDLEGQVHWVPRKFLNSKTSCAVVKTKTAKLRQGPGMDQPLAELSSVDRYTPFRKVDRDGEWVKVEDDYGGKFWIHETNVWIPVSRTKLAF